MTYYSPTADQRYAQVPVAPERKVASIVICEEETEVTRKYTLDPTLDGELLSTETPGASEKRPGGKFTVMLVAEEPTLAEPVPEADLTGVGTAITHAPAFRTQTSLLPFVSCHHVPSVAVVKAVLWAEVPL